jgi:hypothetical protein
VLTTAPTYDIDDGRGGLGGQGGEGSFSIKLLDDSGQRYFTKPIRAQATCEEVVDAVESVPNYVVPKGQTVCFRSSFKDMDGVDKEINSNNFRFFVPALYRFYLSGEKKFKISTKLPFQAAGYSTGYQANTSSDPLLTGDLYYLQFLGNLGGQLAQPEITRYTGDGTRPTLVSRNGVLITASWTNGQQGVDIDYFANHCEG